MRKIILILSIIIFIVSCQIKQEKVNLISSFENEILEIKNYYKIPAISIVISKNDKTIFEKYLGDSDLENAIHNDSTTLFPVASITKVFTSIVLLRLFEEGKLSEEDYVNEFFQNRPFQDNIKIKHILSHTSQGIQPGENFYYSSRFSILTQIIEKSTNHTFEDEVNRVIIKPLKLDHTFLLKDSIQLSKRDEHFARPYSLSDNSEVIEGTIEYGFSSSAGIVSTPRDLLILDDYLNNDFLISHSSKSKMYSSFKEGLPYGYGFFNQSFDGKKIVWVYGQYDSYSSLWVKVPSENITMIILSNNNLSSDSSRLIYGNINTSLFGLSFLKNFIFKSPHLSLFGNIDSTQTPLERELIKTKALVSSFMAQYDPKEFSESVNYLNNMFDQYPEYLEYSDLSLLHNLSFLKDASSYLDLGDFNSFDVQIESIGKRLLKDDPYNPYANYYLGSFYNHKGDFNKSRFHFTRISDNPNFSRNWYTVESEQFLNELNSFIDKE